MGTKCPGQASVFTSAAGVQAGKSTAGQSCFSDLNVAPLLDLPTSHAASSADLRAMAKSDGFVEATRAAGRPRLVDWCTNGYARCRLCPWTRACTDPAKAKDLLGGHFRTHHKGQTASGHQPLNCKLPSLVVDLQDGPAWWRCPLCPMGIRYDAGACAGAPRITRDQMQHKRSSHPRVTWVKWRRVTCEQRAARARQTKFNARTSFNLRCKPHLLARFEPFRWPRPAAKACKLRVKFVKAWVCLKCHAPFEQDKAAEAHVPSLCPTSISPKRLPGLVKRRLRVLAALKTKFEASSATGTYRQQGLTAFEQSARILARPQSPCF